MMNDQNNHNREYPYSEMNALMQNYNFDFSCSDSNSSPKVLKPMENKADIVEKLINFLKTD